MPDKPVLTAQEVMKVLGVKETKFNEIRQSPRFVRLKVEIGELTARFSANNLQKFIDGAIK